MKNILSIDTSDTARITVSLEAEGKRYEQTSESHIHRAQAVLPLIAALLEKHRLKFSDIAEINVHVGPGSFTGIRVGCTVANMLGLLLRVPVNGKKTLVMPQYS